MQKPWQWRGPHWQFDDPIADSDEAILITIGINREIHVATERLSVRGHRRLHGPPNPNLDPADIVEITFIMRSLAT